MKLVAIAAILAVCGAAKLDRTYLPPSSAATAGGSSDSLQTPLMKTSEQAAPSGNLPSGSYTNNFQGVVVDAAAAGTRASAEGDFSGLGGPRDTYGSENSKVGDAAFRGSIAGFRNTPFGSSGFGGQAINAGQISQSGQNVQSINVDSNDQVSQNRRGSENNARQNFGAFENKSERPQAFKDRNSNIISYSNDVNLDNYSYGFETDNGIAVGENGVANNGIQAQGGYSYTGDDGQVYKVTYVADEGGYRPQGDHLPTPPPIPKEILESLEKNAMEEAAGIVDDGSYDAQKYNAEGDYMHHDGGNTQYNSAQSAQFAKRPGSDATASNTFISQNTQAFGKPEQFGNTVSKDAQPIFNGQSNFNGQLNQIGSNFDGLGPQHKESSQALNRYQSSLANHHSAGNLGPNSDSQFVQTHVAFEENNQPTPISQFGSQTLQFTSQANQLSGPNQFTSQTNQGQALSGSSFGNQPSKPSFFSNAASNKKQNQPGNQAFQAQSSFGAEYLPPHSSNNKPQTNKVSSSLESNIDKHVTNVVPLEGQIQGSIQSFSRPQFAVVEQATSPAIQGFQDRPSRLNQASHNYAQSDSNAIPIPSNESPISGLTVSVKPTSIPSTELTTPLEPNEKPAFPQSPQFNSQSSSSFSNTGSQSLNSQVPQTNFQSSVSDSRPQGSSQYDSSSRAPIVSTTPQPSSDEVKSHSPQNFVNQNQQNNAYHSTQKPSLSQGADDSYHYHQPSKPFGTPVASLQGSTFPSMPSYHSNGVFSPQNNQFLHQQGSLADSKQFSSSASVAPTLPTPSSQLTQSQVSFSTNYNGITQASISPFPSVSSTSLSQSYSTQPNNFVSKPTLPSFNSNLANTFGQNPSGSFTYNKNQFGLNSSNNDARSAVQSFPSKPVNTFGQTSTSFDQNQFSHSSTNTDQTHNPETSQEKETSPIQTQQYEGTVYEYNKPPEVLPAPEQTDSSSSQTVHTDSSSKPQNNQKPDGQELKPQFETQQNQFSQSTLSSQPQLTSLNQGIKPQFGSQPFRPFGSTLSSSSQIDQNSQYTFNQQNGQGQQNNEGPTKSNEFVFSTSTQFGRQPAKPFGKDPNQFQFSQSTQQQIQGSQYGGQPFKTFSESQSTTSQLGQNTEPTFGGNVQQNSRPELSAQANKQFGGALSSQFGQVKQQDQNSQQSNKPFRPAGSVQPNKPFSVTQGFQGYPSSKPQFGLNLTPNKFSQSSQHSTQESLKPQFGQNQLNQEAPQPTASYDQPPFRNQFGSTASKPNFGAQSQFGQNRNGADQTFASASSQAQFGLNSAQASSSVVNQPGVQGNKPYGALSHSLQSQNKPQFDQVPQSSQGASTTSSPPQFDTQTFNAAENQNQFSQVQTTQNKSPCCKSSTTGSAIAPLNVGKPSQAFAKTQSQFAGFQGAQGFNAQNLAGKGEEFGGPRLPPSFDAQTGYRY